MRLIFLICSALFLAGCSNYALLDKDAPEYSETYSFATQLRPVILSTPAGQSEGDIMRKLYAAFAEAEDKHGYRERNDEYYGSGSTVHSKAAVIELDFYNRISRSTTHAVSQFLISVEAQADKKIITIAPSNKILKKEGFHLFGRVDTLLEYSSLESYIARIYNEVEWPYSLVEG